MIWNIGDKAYCAIARNVPLSPGFTAPNGRPQQGHTYLVSGFNPHPKGFGLLLAGFPVTSPSGKDCGWMARDFRKLISRTERERATAALKETP